MRGANILICLIGFGIGFNARAASSIGKYESIVERNVFGLKPPPSPEEAPPPPPPPSKITLTGITTMLGNKRALLSVSEPGKQPDNLMLTEGQGENGIEVLQIDENAGTVKVNNHGVEQTLDFKNDGAKAQPGAANTAHVIPPVPGQPPSIPAPIRTIPTRVMRLPPVPPPAGANSENAPQE